MGRSLLLVLALASSAVAQTVTMPQSVEVSVGRLAAVPMTYDGDDFKYVVPPELDAFREYTTDPKEVRLRVIGYKAGLFRIVAVTTKTVDGKAKLSDFNTTLVHVGGVGPQPDPQPEPEPDPTPDPTPGPGPAPIAAPGLRGLFVYEMQGGLSRGQFSVVNSPEVADYIMKHFAKDPNGASSCRQWDDDYVESSFAGNPAPPAYLVNTYMKITRPEAQRLGKGVVTISKADANGNGVGETVVIPETEAEMLALLKKYGGN